MGAATNHNSKVPRSSMRFRSTFLALALTIALPLLGAAPAGYAPPVVVVYPLTSTGGTTRNEAGSDIAVLLATRLAQLGGITVAPPTPGTQRADYLTAALKEGADYYITGSIAPVGGEVSVIAQVVSTYSGTIVYSASTLARTYGEAVANADDIDHAILNHAGRSLAALDAPPPPAASPTPNANNGVGVNILSVLRRHKRVKPTPRPTTSSPAVAAAGSAPNSAAVAAAAGAAAAKPASAPGSRALVVMTGGTADDAARLRATDALVAALAKAGVHSALLPVSADTVAVHAKDLCAANPGASTFYAGTLALGHDAKGSANVQYDVTAYDCAGAVVRQQHQSEPAGKRGGIDAAIATAATRAATAFTRGTKS
jgi:TolB-like protein